MPTRRRPPIQSVAVYLIQRLYGAPAEGAWCYEAGELCTAVDLTAFGTMFPVGREDCAEWTAFEIQTHLDREWNAGDHARPLTS